MIKVPNAPRPRRKGSLDTVGVSRDLLKEFDYHSARVELYVAQIKRRFDFCGFADILAFRTVDLVAFPATGDPDLPVSLSGTLAIQSCAYSGLSTHVNKICLDDDISPRLRDWLLCGNRFEMWGWRLVNLTKKDGTKSKRTKYVPSTRRFVIDDESETGFSWYPNTELALFGYSPDP